MLIGLFGAKRALGLGMGLSSSGTQRFRSPPPPRFWLPVLPCSLGHALFKPSIQAALVFSTSAMTRASMQPRSSVTWSSTPLSALAPSVLVCSCAVDSFSAAFFPSLRGFILIGFLVVSFGHNAFRLRPKMSALSHRLWLSPS